MTSPHERDDRFYGYNQDPYSRDPYRDPYTGYDRGAEYSSGSEMAEPTPIARAEPFLSGRPGGSSTGWKDSGGAALVPPGKFIGGVVMTAAAGCILAWLLAGFVVPGVYSMLDRAGYWSRAAMAAPVSPEVPVWVMLTGSAAIVAGAGMWLLVKVAPAPVMFFRIIGALLSVAVFAATWSSGPTAVTLAPAIAAGAVGAGITLGVGWCGLHVNTGR